MQARAVWWFCLLLAGAACDDVAAVDEVDFAIRERVRDASEFARPVVDAALDAASDPPLDAAPDDADASGPPPWPADAAPPDVDVGAPTLDAEPLEPDAAPLEPDAAPDDQAPAACRAALAAADFTFEGGPEGWTHAVVDGVAADWPFDGWNRGPIASGPGACFEGAECWATHINGNYVQCQRAELRSPVLDLRACAGHPVELVLDHWYDFWSGDDGFDTWFDGGVLEGARSGDPFAVLGAGQAPGVVRINPSIGEYQCLRPDGFYVDGRPGFVGRSDGWQTLRVPLGALPDPATIQIRFVYGTGVSYPTFDPVESQQNARPGWYIDHVRFELVER